MKQAIVISVIGYLVLINLTAFGLYGWDKRKARKGQFRIPEKTLLLLAVCGGSVGAFAGMRRFHHKTQKPGFYIGIPVIIMLQLLCVLYVYMK